MWLTLSECLFFSAYDASVSSCCFVPRIAPPLSARFTFHPEQFTYVCLCLLFAIPKRRVNISESKNLSTKDTSLMDLIMSV